MAKKRVFIDSGSLAGRMSLSPVYAAATGAFILTGLSFLEVFGVLDVFGGRDIVADVLPLPLPIICLAAANSVQYRPILPVERSSSLADASAITRSEEHTSELQSLMRISYAVFCLNKK